jgi:hypothetical protein
MQYKNLTVYTLMGHNCWGTDSATNWPCRRVFSIYLFVFTVSRSVFYKTNFIVPATTRAFHAMTATGKADETRPHENHK